MTREQVKQFIKTTFGIEEPTDEMVSAYLNNVNGAIKVEKDKADLLKEEAEKAKALQAELDAINAEKMSDIEKANAETEKANKQIAELQKQVSDMKVRNKLAEMGITGEQADKFFDKDGQIDFDNLGQIISEREKNASALKEKELLDKTPNPSGSVGGSTPEKSEAEKFAESYAKNLSANNKSSNDALASYLN